jgi:hypothetical protein
VSESYASRGQQETAAGRNLVVAISSLSALLVLAGLIYAVGTGGRQQAALAAAGCEPGLSPAGQPCTTAQMLTASYLAIVTPARQQLDVDAAAYTAAEGHDLTAAEAALTAEAATERAFDKRLARITFPAAIAPLARALIQADQARATLTAEQARSASLTRLRSFNHRVQAAGAAVQADMQHIRKALASPAAG